MKSYFKMAALALWLSTINCQLSTARAQGSLTPPGAPAVSMKTLTQIEPRTPISSAPFLITNPGSYYLTTNLTSVTNAIVILTSGVTLDLSGFTIFSSAPNASSGGAAIVLSGGNSDITIANGHIRGGVTNNGSGVYSGGGFANGIYYSFGGQPVNVLVSHLSVSGCNNWGINLLTGESTVVESCSVRTVGGNGIVASTIKQSQAFDCGGYGIYGDQVSDCHGESRTGDGINATAVLNSYGYSLGAGTGVSASTVQNCYGANGGNGYGIVCTTALSSYGNSGSGIGIYGYIAHGCYGYGPSGYGIFAQESAMGCYGQSSSGIGIYSRNAAFCTGYRSGGTAIQATVASGCFSVLGTNLITYKYNMP